MPLYWLSQDTRNCEVTFIRHSKTKSATHVYPADRSSLYLLTSKDYTVLANGALLATVGLYFKVHRDLWRPACMSTAHPIRVLLVHSHPLARQALRAILQTF